MKRFLPSAAFLVALAASASAAEPPSITVDGSCTAQAAPDRASVSVIAERDAPDAAAAASSAITAMNKLRDDVRALALPDAVIQAGGVQIARIEAENSPDRAPHYTATAQLDVETSSLEGLGRVMQRAAADGIDNVTPMDTYLSPALRDRLVANCLAKAAADARAKAASLLSGLGATLGAAERVSGFSVGGGEGPPRPMGRMRMGPVAAFSGPPIPAVSAGPQTLTVTTSVTFLISSGK